ncbi:Exoenzyme S synthesis protein B [compost metagenome]
MSRLLALLLIVMLSGCVSTPVVQPPLLQLKGEVQLAGVLPRPAIVEVAVLSVIKGRLLQVAATEYEVSILPLAFDVRLTPLQLAEGDLYLRTRLRFSGSSGIQATHQQKVFKAFNNEKIVIKLQPKTCYPQCQQ